MTQDEITNALEKMPENKLFEVACEDESRHAGLVIERKLHKIGELIQVVVQLGFKVFRKTPEDPWMLKVDTYGSKLLQKIARVG
jgi:hypothetical protein